MKRLGIDLGSNSLGWAILSDSRIEDCGVVVFEEGISRTKGVDTLETPAAKRRKYRMARRLKFRRRLRKMHVLKILIEYGMCPLSLEELTAFNKTGIVPDNPAYVEWLKSTPSNINGHKNPYYARAVSAEFKTDRLLVGRALYHLAQRRGFKSSRKNAADNEESSSQASKDLGKVKQNIASLSAELAERNCTLGQYFYQLNQRNIKVRTKHTSRVEHYQKEFERIAEVQCFDDVLKKRLFNALFSQRPLRSQKHLVGKCPLEKQHSRCLIGHPLFELYRMYAFINTIKIDDGSGMRSLNEAERSVIKSLFFRKDRSFEFSRIIKALYPKAKIKKSFPLPADFNYRIDRDVPSCPVAHQLNTLLGEDFSTWKLNKSMSEKSVDYNYQTVFDALIFYDDDDLLREYGKSTLGFSDKKADELVKIRIPDGYANYSLRAIKNILPFLEKGIELSTALLLAKLPSIIGKEKFGANSNKIISDVVELVEDYRRDVKRRDSGIRVIPLNTRLRGYLEDEWKLLPYQIDKLYWNSSAYSKANDDGILGEVKLGMIKNPLVQRSMTILRRLVNELRRTGKIDDDTQINIELARYVNDHNRRLAIEKWQAENAAERKKAEDELRKILNGEAPSEDLIDKYILWNEQDRKCLYTDTDNIKITDFVSSAPKFDIEHTVPRSRSGDNSMANKTLCDLSYNRNIKKGMLPTECPNYSDEIRVRLKPWIEKRNALYDQYRKDMEAAKQIDPSAAERKSKKRQEALVAKLKYEYWAKKVHYFEVTAETLDAGFMNRQLVDTGIMTRHAVDFLRSVYPKTYPVNGLAVAWARKCWELQKQYEKKERIDHTHHVLDAIVIAGLDRKRFQEICTLFRDDGDTVYEETRLKGLLAKTAPFAGFADAARSAVENILVKSLVRHNEFKQTWRKNLMLSHPHTLSDGTVIRQAPAAGSTVRGQLHGETFYGLITTPKEKEKRYVVRKLINDSGTFKSLADIKKIVDGGVRNRLTRQIQDYLNNGKTFKEAIASPLWMKEPDADGNNGVPIIKVRIFADWRKENKTIKGSKIFKSLSDLEKIVDDGVRNRLTRQIQDYLNNGKTFEEAIASPLWMKEPDADGNNGEPIIKVPVFVYGDAERHELKKHLTPSNIEYKNYYYVRSSSKDSNFRIALFEIEKKSKGQMVEDWDCRIDNILTYAKKISNGGNLFENDSDGKFLGYIYQGCAVLKYEHSPDELKALSNLELQKRLYYLLKFEKDGRMTLRFHREARDAGSLSEYLHSINKSSSGDSLFKFNEHQELLRIRSSNIKEHLLFEGIHFNISLDGKLTFI